MNTLNCVSSEDAKNFDGRVIEIDDAGTGDIVGDAFIGLHDVSTGNIIFRGIPVGFYYKKKREKDEDKKEILNAVKDGLDHLHFNKHTDTIFLCRGNCFDKVREWFQIEGIHYKPTIVEGELQDAVEGKLVAHLRKLGVTSHKLTTEAGAKRFFALVNWVADDFPNRHQFIKKGFPCWEKRWKEKLYGWYKQRQRKRRKVKRRAQELVKI